MVSSGCSEGRIRCRVQDNGLLKSLCTWSVASIDGRKQAIGIGDGSQWMSWIRLHDEVEALMWLLEADMEGPVNLTVPEPVTNRELTAALRRPAVLPTPKPALWAKLGRELTGALLYSSGRTVPAVLPRRDFTFDHTNVTTALTAVLAH